MSNKKAVLSTPVIAVETVAGEATITPVEATVAVKTQLPNGTRGEAVFATQLTSLNRRNEKDPHFFGSVKIEGLWYQLATWINIANNVQNLSTAYALMTEEQAIRAEIREEEFQKQRAVRANPLSMPPVNPLAEEGDKPDPNPDSPL